MIKKVYDVYTSTQDLLFTFSHEEALQEQKKHPDAEITICEVEEKPGETAYEAFTRGFEEKTEIFLKIFNNF